MIYLKNLIIEAKRSPLGKLLRQARSEAMRRKWEKQGRQGQAPHAHKVDLVTQYALQYGTSIFLETGTYLGDMVYAVKEHFRRVYSVEIDPALYERAVRRFAGDEHVSILHGDSAIVVPQLLEEIDGPCLFWLDGHFSGGVTGLGDKVSPLLGELRHIFSAPRYDHVMLIDDARQCRSGTGYPEMHEIRDLVARERPDFSFEVKDDVIRVCPRRSS